MGKIFINLDLPDKTAILILGKLHSISICLVHQSDVYCSVNCIWAFKKIISFEGFACHQPV